MKDERGKNYGKDNENYKGNGISNSKGKHQEYGF